MVTPSDKEGTRGESNGPEVGDPVAAVEEFWQSLGARSVRMSPEEHDRAVAEISHLPHLLASALASCAAQQDLALAAGGWRDTTRVAAGDVELWRQIFLENRRHVLQSLDKFEKVLAEFRRAVERNDPGELVRLLERYVIKVSVAGFNSALTTNRVFSIGTSYSTTVSNAPSLQF